MPTKRRAPRPDQPTSRPTVPPRDEAAETLKMRGYLPHYVSRLMNLLNLRLLERIRPANLTVQQFRVLQTIDARGAASVSEISRDAVIEQSVVSRVVDQLEERGYAQRRKRPGGARVVDVYLTPAGVATYATLFPHARAIVDDAMGGLSAAENAQLEKLLRRMFEHVSRPYAPWDLSAAPDTPAPSRKSRKTA